MAKRETFWTDDRLRELARLFKTHSVGQLERHFGKRREDITQAYEYYRMHKRLKISSRKNKKTRITIYKAAWAEGSREGSAYQFENLVL